jgi:hypothetical protein
MKVMKVRYRALTYVTSITFVTFITCLDPIRHPQ